MSPLKVPDSTRHTEAIAIRHHSVIFSREPSVVCSGVFAQIARFVSPGRESARSGAKRVG